MKLELRNIAKVAHASIEIDGISVITGKNDSGKSTAGKALFAVWNGIFDSHRDCKSQRIFVIEKQLRSMEKIVYGSLTGYAHDLARTIVSDEAFWHMNLEELLERVASLYSIASAEISSKQAAMACLENVISVLAISDLDCQKALIRNRLRTTFKDQICNVYAEDRRCQMRLSLDEFDLSLMIDSDGVVSIAGSSTLLLHMDVIYMDDPFVVDKLGLFISTHEGFSKIANSGNHRDHLLFKLLDSFHYCNVFDEVVAQNHLEQIEQKLAAVCNGDLVIATNPDSVVYKQPGSNKVLRASNLSAGLKTFVILKRLLKGCVLQKGGLLIMDEPETHLHPEWQVLLAELIVLLNRDYGIHFLISTSSPHFLRAMDIYTKHYEVTAHSRFYLAENEGLFSNVKEVTSNLDAVYTNLFKPFL